MTIQSDGASSYQHIAYKQAIAYSIICSKVEKEIGLLLDGGKIK